MNQKRPSQWPVLFDTAVNILEHFRATHGYMPAWSFGGGTALMLQIDHRESHDIDLFLDDPQLLPFLNPETQSITLERKPDSYSSDGIRMLKLAYIDLGEIDFICAPSITCNPTIYRDIRGQNVALETPAEIIAKKVHFRGSSFQPRDMFDLAAVAESYGEDYALSALRQSGLKKCETALACVEKTNRQAVAALNQQLLVRESTEHLAADARDITHDLLRAAIKGASGD